MSVTIRDIRAAAAAIKGSVMETPLVHSRTLSEISGATLFLKLENLQYTASFKDRGALVRLLALTDKERASGIIAMSAGNHAQSVAYHAANLGVAATIVMPRATPFVKVRNTETLGARVVLHGETLDETSAFAHAEAKRRKLTFVHPYDDERIIAGQGTLALEMLEAEPDLDVLVVPVGGGGLISGCAIAAKAVKPDIEIIGVQAELYSSMYEALREQRPAAGGFTIAEGIAVKQPGKLTLPVVEKLVSDLLLVSERAIEEAVQFIAEIEKLVAEGAGAAPLAAVLENRERFAGRRVGLVISGGNIDSRLLASVLMRGLARSGRLIRLRVQVSDVPGSLANVSRRMGELGGNIVEVHHERWFYDVPVRLTEIDMLVEIRDPDNATEIIAGLADAGFPARLLRNTALDDG